MYKVRLVVLSSLLIILILVSACMSKKDSRSESETISSAKPVIVPYLNTNIKNIYREDYDVQEIESNRPVKENISEFTDSGDYAGTNTYDTTKYDGLDRDSIKTEQFSSKPEYGQSASGTGYSENTSNVGDIIESNQNSGTIETEYGDVVYESSDPELTYLGNWITTAYCPCEICCGEWATGCTASGVLATANHTVACGILPFGTRVMIDGIIYTVEDTGVDGEWIDIFFDTHEEALVYGQRVSEVYLVND